jgi:hypothetical protein
MITVKPQGTDLDRLRRAAAMLRKANALFGIAKKDSESAKAEISAWLKAERQIDIEALEIGQMVNVENVCIIERGKQNKFDEKSFLFEQPELHAKYKRDLPITKYKALS